MTDEELREWALARYGPGQIADDQELTRLLHEDVATVDAHGEFPVDDDLPFHAFMADLNDRLERSARPDSAVQAQRKAATRRLG